MAYRRKALAAPQRSGHQGLVDRQGEARRAALPTALGSHRNGISVVDREDESMKFGDGRD